MSDARPGHTLVVTRETAMQVRHEDLHKFAQAMPGMAKPPWYTRDTIIFVSGLLLPLILYAMLRAGFAAMNQAESDTQQGGLLYLVTAIMVVVAAAGMALLDPKRAWVRIGTGLMGAVPLGLLLAIGLENQYGLPGIVSFLAGGLSFTLFVLSVAIWLTALIAGLVVASRRGGAGAADVAGICGLMLGGGSGIAAVWHLVTLERQSELSARAHDTPGLGLVATAVMLVAAACLLRRRRG